MTASDGAQASAPVVGTTPENVTVAPLATIDGETDTDGPAAPATPTKAGVTTVVAANSTPAPASITVRSPRQPHRRSRIANLPARQWT